MRITIKRLHQTGMTLIEIMIAMLLGLFLLGGLLQIFISSKQTYRMQEGLSRLQENGRFAIDFMTRDIRLAGYKGCGSRNYDAILASNSILAIQDPPNPATDFLYDFNSAIQGFEAVSTTAWSPAMVPDIPSPLGGSDVITIRRADDQGFSVTAHSFNTGANTSALTLDSATATTANLQAAGFLSSATTPANQCAIAVVSNCQTARVFQVSAMTGNVLAHNGTGGDCAIGTGTIPPGNLTNNLIDTYFPGGQVRLINTISYFVGTAANGQSSLFQRIGANNSQALVEGVEGMEIFYGVDTDAEGTAGYGTANYYVIANQVNAADWAKKVVSVRISLLVATIDNNLTAQPTASFTFNGQNTPADRRLRRVFTSTIALRNRLP